MPGELNQKQNEFKVSLRSASVPTFKHNKKEAGVRIVEFDVTPEITESRNVEYKTMNPIHMPGTIYVYGSTSSRTYALSSVKLISRTMEEASKNMTRLWTLRGWTMPQFGERSSTLSEQQVLNRRIMERDGFLSEKNVEVVNKDKASNSRDLYDQGVGTELLGKPPEVLFLNAYSDIPAFVGNGASRYSRNIATNISNIPVVIQSLSIPYPSDVDYIPTLSGQPFPRVMILDIQLVETRAPREFAKKFSLQDFRSGTLRNF